MNARLRRSLAKGGIRKTTCPKCLHFGYGLRSCKCDDAGCSCGGKG